MILCAMPFLNELDLLEVKFRELEGVVDVFAIIESPVTFTGIPKPLVFAENAERFKRWRVWHVVAPARDAASAWEREDGQRSVIYETIANLRPEVAIYCDADECPRREAVQRYVAELSGVHTLEMAQMLFYFDRVDPTITWKNVKIWRPKPGEERPWRMTVCPAIPDAGWHFEYFGRRELLMQKLAAFSHAGEPGCVSFIKGLEAGRLPGLERTAYYPIDLLPRFVRDNRERFAANFCDTPLRLG